MTPQRKGWLAAAVIAALLLPAAPVAAGEPQSQPAKKEVPERAQAGKEPSGEKMEEPDFIKVQHILIGFTGSARATSSTRTPDEARSLAKELLKRAQKGEDFAALAKQYSDDRPPGIYTMSNTGVTPRQQPPNEFPRERMVPAFGNVGFALKVGEVGMSDYDPKESPFGYHIIKRLE